MGLKLASTAQLCQQSTFVFCSWFPLALALSGGRKKLLFVTLEKFSPFCFSLFGERVKLKFKMSFIINSTISQGLSALPLLSPNGIWVYGSIEIASLFWKKSDLHSLTCLFLLCSEHWCFCPSASALEVTTAGAACGLLFWHRHGMMIPEELGYLLADEAALLLLVMLESSRELTPIRFQASTVHSQAWVAGSFHHCL